MWNTGSRQQRIKKIRIRMKTVLGSKQSGQAEWAAGLLLTLFLAILLCCELQIQGYRASALYLEDALAASGLASAIIDPEEYGISHTLRIKDPSVAFALYKNALKENLGLDENMECVNKSLISGRVMVERYIIYNVKGSKVGIYEVGEEGHLWDGTGNLGEVRAPNGILIEATGVYSEISFPVEGLFGVTTEAHKGKLVDIVEN